jgi:polyribonucleotide nucleotidyltransferase
MRFAPIWKTPSIPTSTTLESYSLADAAKKKAGELFPDAATDPEKPKMIKRIFSSLKEKIFRDEILRKRERPDRRKFDTIRPIWIETRVLPRTHGSAVFTRGETQALVTATLGTSEDVQRMDWLEGESKKRFMMHYNFPPFSVGEVSLAPWPARNRSRRSPNAPTVMPTKRRFLHDSLVSDILNRMVFRWQPSRRNCLMDCVPTRLLAGVAMGLVKEGDNYAILSDIVALKTTTATWTSRSRNTRRHHSAANGHQDCGSHFPNHVGSAGPGEGRAPPHSRQDG